MSQKYDKIETLSRVAKRTANIQGRKEKLIPAVVYGPKQDSTPLFLKENFFDVTGALAGSTIYSLEGDVLAGSKVMIKKIDKNPRGNKILHVDLYAPDMTGELEVEVPLDFQGKAKGVVEEGGIFNEIRREIVLKCPVTDIPESLTVDISELAVGDTLQVKDLTIPEKYTLISSPDYAVATVSEAKAEAEEAPAAAEGEAATAGETPAEG